MANILIVEDDLGIRKSFKQLLTKQGWQTTIAGDGREALKAIATGLPDIILLDILMPNMGGVEFLEAYQKLKPKDGGPTILVMTNSQVPTDTEQHVRQLGASEYLAKVKVSPNDLISLIRSYLKE